MQIFLKPFPFQFWFSPAVFTSGLFYNFTFVGLPELQYKSRLRHFPNDNYTKRSKKNFLADVIWLVRHEYQYNTFLENKGVVKIKRKRKRQLEEKNVDFQKVFSFAKMYVQKIEVPEDEAEIIIDRPPAIYTQSPSPYGIANELHGQQIKVS